MRAVKFTRYGGPDVLDVVEVPRPTAGPRQVVVAVVAAATNPGEIGIREGLFADIWPAHFPEGQGNDFAGYVAEIGSGTHEFAVGDEVIGFAPRAAQAEYVAPPPRSGRGQTRRPVVGRGRDDRGSRGHCMGVGRRDQPTTR